MSQFRMLPVIKYITYLLLMIIPTSAFAIGESLQSLEPSVVSTLVFSGIGIILVLLLGLILVFVRGKNKVEKEKQRVAEKQQEQEYLPVGLIHLSLDGKVLYINESACKLLGRVKDSLNNKTLGEFFENKYAQDIEIASKEPNAVLQVKARASNRYVSLKFGELQGEGRAQFQIVCLCDEDTIQKELTDTIELCQQQKDVFNVMELGQAWVNVNKDTFVYEKYFAQLLLFDGFGQESGQSINAYVERYSQAASFSEFIERVHPGDSGIWAKALVEAKTKGKATLICRIQLNTASDAKVYVASKITMVGYKDIDGECDRIHICISDHTQFDKDKQELDNTTQQQQALLNATNNGVYAIEKSGQIIWTNSAFNMLFRRMFPSSKSKNLFELDFFPEEVKKLHQNSPGLSGRSYNIEYEIPNPEYSESDEKSNSLQESKMLHFKLTLAFFNSKDRLSEQSQMNIIGVMHNVSEQKQAENMLLQHQEETATMLNLAPVAIATIDAEDKIISANSVMSRRLGFSDTELKRQDFYELFNDAGEAGKSAKKIHQTGHLRDFHAELKGKDKKLHPSELHVDIISKEHQEYLVWIADRSDEQFQQDKFDSLLEHSSMPMAILGENGFTKLNDAACSFFCVGEEQDFFGIYPHSNRVNTDEDKANALQQMLEEIKASGKAKSFSWEHKVGDLLLPCQATYVPLYKDQAFDSVLCIWIDNRELQKAEDNRILAINLQQAAEREIEEKQKLLASSQDQLATKMRTLADTEQKLQTVQEDLSETQSEYVSLQAEHRNITDNLIQLKAEYGESREMLADAQKLNTELNNQLESTSQEVKGLNTQREEIAAALKESEQKYEAAQKELAESEENANLLKQKQEIQHRKMHALVTQIQTMKRSVNDKDDQITQVSEQINSLQSQLQSSSSTTDKLREQLVNQRKASEKAELERREIEQNCQIAQAELRNKERHLSHLQSEMEKLEEMSTQEKGDMEAQQSALKKELEDKLKQLNETENALSAAQDAAEKEKQEKAHQQELLSQVKQELIEIENTAQEKQKALEAKEREQKLAQQALQQKLWTELKAKQERLQETEQILNQAKQQTESEKAEKEKHRQLFEQLKAELSDIEQRNSEQEAKMAETDKQWHESKEALNQEVEAKRSQLDETKEALDRIQRQADKERLARIEQEQKLQQLTIELSDVETRANKQKEMLEGSDEQWRKHHDEIEQQKRQLQEALQQAQYQNENLQTKLSSKLHALQEAESQVDKTQSGEQALQKELESARTQAEELQSKIAQQERKELELQHQLEAQQEALESKESSINELESKQKALTEELVSVQKEYAKSKESLSAQDNSRSDLSSQMGDLESALEQSKKALAEKESALQQAQQELESSQSKLAEQESALLSAHKQELEEATQDSSSRKPEIEKLPLPSKPAVWFDLLPYLQSQPQIESLPVALTELMNELASSIHATEKALDDNNTRELLASSKKLVAVSQKINSDALTYLMSSIQDDCTNGMVDNVSIRWPATKQGLEKTLRVVYSHLHA